VPQVHIRLADPAIDNPALCTLSRACPQGSRLRFYHARDDHWERCRHFRETQVRVAEVRGEVIGAASLAFKEVWLADRLERVAYLFDRMVHPAWRRQGVARALLRQELQACAETALQYGLILEDNHPNRRLLESEGFRCHPHRLLYLSMIPALARRGAPPIHLVEPIAASKGAHLDQLLRPAYAMVDISSSCGMGLFNVGGLNSQAAGVFYRHGLKVVTQAPWYYNLLGRIVGGLPRLQTPAQCWALGHIWRENGAALQRLLAAVAAAAQMENVALVLLPLYANDPMLERVHSCTINRWGVAPVRVCLYLRGDSTPTLLRANRPLLASPRDG
jgi:GNAT superfamily N-acetyltransferase